MQTTKTARSKKIEGTNFYATPTGLRLGTKGKVVPPGQVFAQLSKGEARRLRKRLYRMGEMRKAAERRGA